MKSSAVTRLARYFVLLSLVFGVSQSIAAQEVSNEFDQALVEKTLTFEAANPYDQTPGLVTLTVSGGAFHVQRIGYGSKAVSTLITGDQQGEFKFVPYDTSQPSFAGDFKFGLSGEIPFDRHSDVMPLNFIIRTKGSDGSERTFILGELAKVSEYAADVSFGELQTLRLESEPATP